MKIDSILEANLYFKSIRYFLCFFDYRSYRKNMNNLLRKFNLTVVLKNLNNTFNLSVISYFFQVVCLTIGQKAIVLIFFRQPEVKGQNQNVNLIKMIHMACMKPLWKQGKILSYLVKPFGMELYILYIIHFIM